MGGAGAGGTGGTKRKGSAGGAAVAVVNANPAPRTPHGRLDRLNRPMADEQLGLSVVSPVMGVVFFFFVLQGRAGGL